MQQPQRPHLSLVRTSGERTRASGSDRMTRLGEHIVIHPPTTPPPADLTWTCPVCGVVPPLALPSGKVWIKRSCACQRRVREEEAREQERRVWCHHQAWRTFGGWLGEKWVDDATVREMKQKTFATYDATYFPEAYQKTRAFASTLKGNMVLYGSYGVGKTHLEAAVCNYLREEHVTPETSLFVSAPLLFVAYQDSLKMSDMTRHLSLMQQVMETPLLVLDDVDKLKPTEFRHETYWLILDERYKAKRPTIVSTNKMNDLGEYIGDAALSRLQRGMIPVGMLGADYRSLEDV